MEEKGNIKIFNKKVLPDSKISLKFNKLKTEEGIKKLMRACGVRNYATIFTKHDETGEARVASLILVKAGIASGAGVEKKPEARTVTLPSPVEENAEAIEVSKNEIVAAKKEIFVETIRPILEEVDNETREEIMKDIMDWELSMLDELW